MVKRWLMLLLAPLSLTFAGEETLILMPEPGETQGLIAHWSFDSSAQNKYYDMTGNGFDAISIKKPVSLISGSKDTGLNCESDSFLIRVENSEGIFNFPNFTVEGWIYSYINLVNPGSFFNSHSIFTTQTWIPSQLAEGFELSINDNGYLQLTMAHPTQTSWIFCTSDTILQPRTWYHVAATYDGTNMIVYANGQVTGTVNFSGGYKPSHSDAVIGCQMPQDSSEWRNWFNGIIDELKLYNYALDEQAISSIYSGSKPEEKPPFEINFGMKTTYAQPGDTVIMPVFLSNFEEFSISSCQFTMSFDTSIVSLVDITKDSGLVSDWPLFSWHEASPHIVNIGISGTSTTVGYGEGELVRCIFRVKPAASQRDTCVIELFDIIIDEFNIIRSNSKNGKIIIDAIDILYGDVTGNGEVNIFDAQKVLAYVVGAITLPDSVCCPNFTTAVADVSGNGTVTSYDAALIFQHSFGLLPDFPVQTTAQHRLTKRTTTTAATLSFDIEDNGTDGINFHLKGSHLRGFHAGEFSILYNPDIVNLSRGSINTPVRGATMNSKINTEEKLLKVALATNDDIDVNDPVTLISINLPPATGSVTTALSIANALINEGSIPIRFENGQTQSKFGGPFGAGITSPRLQITGKQLVLFHSKENNVDVRIWTLNGKSIGKIPIRSGSTFDSICLDRLAQGMYLYHIKTGNSIFKGKFVIHNY